MLCMVRIDFSLVLPLASEVIVLQITAGLRWVHPLSMSVGALVLWN